MKITELVTAMTALTDRIDAERGQSALLRRIAEGQEKLLEAMQDGGGGSGSDPESRMRLRSIDVQLLRILEEMSRRPAGNADRPASRHRPADRRNPPAVARHGRARLSMVARARRRDSSLIWPGFVDAVTTLLMVLMFVLTIFTVMQSVLARHDHHARTPNCRR